MQIVEVFLASTRSPTHLSSAANCSASTDVLLREATPVVGDGDLPRPASALVLRSNMQAAAKSDLVTCGSSRPVLKNRPGLAGSSAPTLKGRGREVTDAASETAHHTQHTHTTRHHTTPHTTLHKNNVRRGILYIAQADSQLHQTALRRAAVSAGSPPTRTDAHPCPKERV